MVLVLPMSCDVTTMVTEIHCPDTSQKAKTCCLGRLCTVEIRRGLGLLAWLGGQVVLQRNEGGASIFCYQNRKLNKQLTHYANI